ncbi:hypothetical protein HPB50_005325 [Hyalomma asiaticum]|uniref:Uncharacterized protein n=1 Tax=Hyalomma asiaticum TaxID=266040 RepID=A0ACB7S6M6_HYAAI|nr:hypothetical protein HPB50_005325 [Hyalomma asiaticum]
MTSKTVSNFFSGSAAHKLLKVRHYQVDNEKVKKWSKGKVRDKLNNLVLFDKATYDKLLKEVPSYKLITPSVVSERLKVRGSLARKALEELLQKGLIKQVVKHHSQIIYTRTTKAEDA